MKKFIRVMKALSDPSRVKIIKMLETKDLCVCEMTALLGLAQSTVSKHLKILEDADLVTSNRDGAWVNYAISTEDDSPYARALLDHMKEWLNDDPGIRQVRQVLPTVDRERINAA